MSESLIAKNPFIETLFDEFYAVKENQNSIQYKYAGNNQQRFVMLTDKTLTDSESNLLSNIIQGGLKLNPQELAIINIAEQDAQASISNLIITLKPLKMIIWGCNEALKKEGWKIEQHQMAIVRSTQIFKANPLQEYETNKDLKLQLWNLGIKKLI